MKKSEEVHLRLDTLSVNSRKERRRDDKIGSNNGNALIRSISPILHCVNALDLRGREREKKGKK